MEIRYLLISDGSSDSALIPLLNFLLSKKLNTKSIIGERADFYRIKTPPKTIKEKILVGIDLYEPDIIFIDRDAEAEDIQERINEIEEALKEVNLDMQFLKVIPIRMTEAWFLIEEMAIRKASGNPNGKIKLQLPAITRLEKIPHPKSILEKLIIEASELKGRRLFSLNTKRCIHLVAENIENYTLLAPLHGYQYLQEQIDKLEI